MQRHFRPSDNEREFRYTGAVYPSLRNAVGRLEFPLMDPGTASSTEGALWFGPVNDPEIWCYVSHEDVEET